MKATHLPFQKLGSGHPLIILHGLYGMGSNWLSIGKALSGLSEVYLVDQRNHGEAFHDPVHTYQAMMQDVIRLMDELGLAKAVVLGHSMGGKVAMHMALHHPERITRLIVADISPLAYTTDHSSRNQMGGHRRIISALKAIDLKAFSTLKDIEGQLEPHFPDRPLRQFLMKNLGKDDQGAFYWKLNLDALLNHLDRLAEGLDPSQIPMEGLRQFPALFIKGELSAYIQREDERAVRRIFPLSQVVTIKGAGHWLHAEQPERFVKTVRQFLLKQSGWSD